MKSAKNILTPSARPLRTVILVPEETNTLSFAAAVDPMRAANRMAGRPLFDWRFATPDGAPSQLTSGIAVPGEALARVSGCDLLLTVAGFGLERHDTPALRASLRRIAATGATLAGVDGGPWLMAAAGLLDGYRATTHWEDLDRFATRFPEVQVLQDRFHIDGPRMTCGGALPAIDMMLHLIGHRFGTPLAARVAGLFLYDSPGDPARAQRRLGRDPRHSALTRKASLLMEQNLDAPLPIAEIARRCGCSARSLETQFRARLDTTPSAHALSLRLAEARRLVLETDLPLMDVALATGFASAAGFSRAFRAAHGQSARSLRRARP
ncbi:GlxA family transcriptional regulator [Pseudodonghicola flavimaris]|uniref:GlxA family transcriptional regulator n=1 Tax=Pseudodonghicola flavimaris TaxID=3050036 RepID=A0ABT7F4K6_9RHOB|nr:GlxA family transcriptional regulator [Pseudodonghicola flavimaris]MDK3019549.1 GlxA family transcriptional regulator [Pseudodonghicola flavimaris]